MKWRKGFTEPYRATAYSERIHPSFQGEQHPEGWKKWRMRSLSEAKRGVTSKVPLKSSRKPGMVLHICDNKC
jgi:hypothetical protein